MTESICEYLPWDSDFFGARIGRARLAAPLTSTQLDAIDRWCDENRIDCLYLFTPIDDAAGIILAEDRGFRLVDVRIHYERQMNLPFVPVQSRGTVRDLRDSDAPGLLDLASRSHRATRFYADPHFSHEQSDRFYRFWLQKSITGWADRVLVSELDGRPCGYLTLHIDTPEVGWFALMAVEEEARGNGLATLLVARGLEWFREQGVSRTTWPTQARSITSQRLCLRLGFELISIGAWHHRWRQP